MRALFCITASLIILTAPAFSQSQEAADIYLGVFSPEQMDGLNESQLGKINTKIEQICSLSGISSGYTPEGFAIYPVFEIYEDETVEGGMQNVYSVKAQMTLFIKQYNGVLVGSVSKTYSGFGKSKNQAVVNAIQNINPKEPAFKRFMDTSKEKIVDYYRTHCGQMIDKADMFASQEKYDEAIALLMSIPENVSCYSNVLVKVSKLYELIIEQRAQYFYSIAQTAYASRDYERMAFAIAQISPKSQLYPEAEKLISSMNEKFTAEEKRNWDFKMQQYNDELKLEKQRISAVKEIAKAYYQNKPDITYNLIIK